MSSYSLEEYALYDDINFDEEIQSCKAIEELKEDLLPYYLDEPIFFNYYKYLAMENIEKKFENDNENNYETDKKLQKEEQIDKIKFRCFLMLYLECNYNGQYEGMICNNYIKAKRLIIQQYKLKDHNIIEFDKKNYCFIPQFTKAQKGIVFNYNGQSFEVTYDKKKSKMSAKSNQIITKNEFAKKNNIKNLYEEIRNFRKAKSQIKSEKKNKRDINDINLNNSDNKSNNSKDIKKQNKALSQNAPKENDNYSKITDRSDNEIDGDIFFDNNNRYIFKSDYSKEIDGIFTEHKTIKLNKEREIDLFKSLDSLIENEYDINNDIQCNIIYKNFEDNKIPENEPFFLGVKKSMDLLYDLLKQIKEISKVIGGASKKLPKYIIGIICKFDNNQIEFQKKELKKKYKDNGKDIFLDYVMKVINDNKINVIIGVIKDEQIFNYPLGIDDFLIEGASLEKRIDIQYMNNLICNGKVSKERIDEICKKYPFKSLYYEKKVSYSDYMKMCEKYSKLNLEMNTIKEEKEEEMKTIEENKITEIKEMKERFENEIKGMKKKHENEIIEMIEKYENELIKHENEKIEMNKKYENDLKIMKENFKAQIMEYQRKLHEMEKMKENQKETKDKKEN